jgi:PAS domain S-box-containing protein
MTKKKEKDNKRTGIKKGNTTSKLSSSKKKISKNIQQFEELISGFSTVLNNTPENDLETELNIWIKNIVGFLKVDRGVVIERKPDSKTVNVLMQYSVPEVDIEPLNSIYTIPDEEVDEFQKGMFLRAEKIPQDLPDMLRGGLIEQDNTKSVVIVPLSAGGKVIGSLTFATYRDEHKWSDDIVRGIKLIGEIIGSAVLRLRSDQMLLNEKERRQVLEQQYSVVLKNAIVGFWIADFNGHIIDVNDEYCRISGYSRDELLTMNIEDLDVMPLPERMVKLAKNIESIGAFHHEVTHRKKDGTLIDLDVSTTVLQESKISFSFMRDITEFNQTRKEKDEQLKFEELITEFSNTMINIQTEDINHTINIWLKKFVEFLNADRGIINEHLYEQEMVHMLFNYSVPEIDIPLTYYHKTHWDIIEMFAKGMSIKAENIPEDLPSALKGGLIEKENVKTLLIVPIIASNKIFGNLTFLNYRNEKKWPNDLVKRVKLIGEIIGNAFLRIRTHEALVLEMERRHLLEERYSSIIKTANVGFMISDMNANILEVNNTYCEMSGYSRDDLQSMKIYDLDISHDPEKVEKDKSIIFQTGSFHHESIHIRKDGKTINVLVSANLLEKENIICCFIRDVTELKIAQEDLENRLEFEKLTSEFSAALINLKLDKIDDELYPWVKKYVDFFKVERGILNEYDYKNLRVNVITTYTDTNVNVPPTDNSNEASPLIMEKLAKGDVIRAEKIPEDIPNMFNDGIIKKHGTKSILIVPLSAENQIIGNLTFATYTEEHRWSDEFVRRIKLIGEIIANAILRKQSNDALIKEMERRQLLEERYTSIIKNANVGFMITDLDQNILVVNDEYCRLSGFTRDELVRMKIIDIDYSENKEKVEGYGSETVEHGSLFHQSRHIQKSGKIFDVEVNSNYLESEKIIFSFIRDVTELNHAKRELEERLTFEELLSDFSATLINVKLNDIKTELDNWLRRFSEFLDVDRWAIGEYANNYGIYRFLCTYSNPELTPQPPAFPDVMIHDGRYGLEKYLMKGEFIKLDSSSDRLPDDLKMWEQKVRDDGTKSILMLPLIAEDSLLGSIVIATFIHEKRWTGEIIRRLRLVAEIFTNSLMREKTDNELDIYRKHLEKMVEERTARLEKAQKDLVLSEKMATLGKLTATVSHELRNPLGTIRSSVFSIGKRLKGQDEKVIAALDRAERNIRRCDLIIDELLNYSRIQELKLESVVLDAWIREVLDEIKPPSEIFIKTELGAGVIIDIDQERFRRCIINILTNAYQAIKEKGSDEPGYVTVNTRKENNVMVLEISDNGVGFDMDIKNKLFEPLFSTKAFGVGLGIPITKQIIEQHGFKMDMRGEPGKGASVIITIPVIDIN